MWKRILRLTALISGFAALLIYSLNWALILRYQTVQISFARRAWCRWLEKYVEPVALLLMLGSLGWMLWEETLGIVVKWAGQLRKESAEKGSGGRN